MGHLWGYNEKCCFYQPTWTFATQKKRWLIGNLFAKLVYNSNSVGVIGVISNYFIGMMNRFINGEYHLDGRIDSLHWINSSTLKMASAWWKPIFQAPVWQGLFQFIGGYGVYYIVINIWTYIYIYVHIYIYTCVYIYINTYGRIHLDKMFPHHL